MCGLAGIIRYDGGATRQIDRVLAMRDRQRHRGPDGHGLWHDDCAVLGHVRLALVDAENGAQPMPSADGRYVLVYNGEIYNHAALRAELAAHWTFRSRSDSEVVLAAYAVWGEACVHRFNGMFAFLVWDSLHRQAFAARDRLGIKPFVYAEQDGEFLFASEAKAILPALRNRPRADLEALTEYLVAPFFSGVERPMFEGMAYLAPGHALRFGRDGTRVWSWSIEPSGADNASDWTGTAAEMRRRLGDAVERTLLADAPVGLFLSGGLDSTLIGALASRAGATPEGFTIAFAGHDRYDYAASLIVDSDDQPFAELASSELCLPRIDVTPARDIFGDSVRAVAAQNDALPAWEQELAQHHLARAAGSRVKAVMVGDAADETHYGYHFLLDPHATRDPLHVLQRLTGDPYLRPGMLARPLEHFAAKYRALASDAGHEWTTPGGGLRATQWLVRHRWLQRLLHNGDIHCMAHGVESRVPFGDTALLDLAASVAPEDALRHGVEKAMLREASRGLVPEAIRRRRKSALPKDQGMGEWLRRHARDTLATQGEAVAAIMDVPRLLRRCADPALLDEHDRAVLFRASAVSHWATLHEVSLA
ncbi:MAG: asparagine synthase (glutamine-hydrolyzing) [Luteibacter sp.]